MFNGDITLEMLGLSEENLKHVTENTNIVFHMAATLKLEGNLTDAVNMNLAGTRRAIDVARKMKNLEAFVHLSTAFCNCDQEVMYEKVYDFPHKPEELMRIAEWMDVPTLDAVTPKLLPPHPNTYTYTKRLAELYVRDQYETMPVIIARPSIGKSKDDFFLGLILRLTGKRKLNKKQGRLFDFASFKTCGFFRL